MLIWLEVKSRPRASPCPGITHVLSVGVRGEKKGFGVCAVVAPGPFL